MNLALSLCSNCAYSPSCHFKNGKTVFECEEYSAEEEQYLYAASYPDLVRKENTGNRLSHFKGLCGNCELRDDCLWRNDDIITFHCEHYQ